MISTRSDLRKRVGGSSAIALACATLIQTIATGPSRADLVAGNTIYEVTVLDTGAALGTYLVHTAEGHPAGDAIAVVLNGVTSVRSFTTDTTYCVPYFLVCEDGSISLDPYAAVSALGETGVRTTYTLPGSPTTPDQLTIVLDVQVLGTTFEDSVVEVEVSVQNGGEAAVEVGIRYFWDYGIGEGDLSTFDDGPTFQQQLPAGAVLTNETDFPAPTFESFRIEDNDVNASPPTLTIFGTVTGPSLLAPTPPDRLVFSCWELAAQTSFDYTASASRVIAFADVSCDSGATGGDSSVLYYFGADETTAVEIAAAGSASVSASMFLSGPLFGDGFETGDVCQWSGQQGAPDC